MYDIRTKTSNNPQEIQFADFDLDECFGCIIKNRSSDQYIEITNEEGDESISVGYEDLNNLIEALETARDTFGWY